MAGEGEVPASGAQVLHRGPRQPSRKDSPIHMHVPATLLLTPDIPKLPHVSFSQGQKNPQGSQCPGPSGGRILIFMGPLGGDSGRSGSDVGCSLSALSWFTK